MSKAQHDWQALGQEMLVRAAGEDRQAFNSFFLSRLFGFKVSYPGDECLVAFEAIPTLFNPQGTLHGGVLATALDISMGHLLNHRAGPGATLEMKIQYIAPIGGGEVTCRASFLRQGRGISYLQSHAFRADGELAAHATATWKLLKAG
ncbi:PaaI family thioesterase [Bosea sp. (in: a-proteobacteria)]|uniref:PaaI family thioesterase n=1 Tax=Bosea sp. (in: a-proteobacteria) TaxID=1871050 RepID=UPI00262460D9|nr:PaaI family thioesterase [Bosea sp. (in: a-proteobacteria)]MCO5089528.1 PaaI family thioesterase [Bosea sp. (in: a-proteobacteria)]